MQQAGGPGSRCGSDQRAVMPSRVRAVGRGYQLADRAIRRAAHSLRRRESRLQLSGRTSRHVRAALRVAITEAVPFPHGREQPDCDIDRFEIVEPPSDHQRVPRPEIEQVAGDDTERPAVTGRQGVRVSGDERVRQGLVPGPSRSIRARAASQVRKKDLERIGVLLDLCRVGHGAARTMDGGGARMARASGRGRQLAGSNAIESITCWSSARSAAWRSAGWFVNNV